MSTTQFQPGGNRIPEATRVAADQSTILGDGSSENPLRAGGSTNTNRITFLNASGRDIGTPVALGNSLSTEASLQNAIANSLSPAGPNAFAIGLVVESVSVGTGDVVVQTGDRCTLTPDEWNNITGSSILVAGDTYYVSPVSATLTNIRPVTSGQFIVVIGKALNRTTMLITPSAPQLVP